MVGGMNTILTTIFMSNPIHPITKRQLLDFEGRHLNIYSDRVRQPDGEMISVGISCGAGRLLLKFPKEVTYAERKILDRVLNVSVSKGGATGLRMDEINLMLENDLKQVHEDLIEIKGSVFTDLVEPRKAVLLNMAYQLGITGCLSFKKMWANIKDKEFKQAAVEMIDSKWAKQTYARALALSEQMKQGKWPRKYTP